MPKFLIIILLVFLGFAVIAGCNQKNLSISSNSPDETKEYWLEWNTDLEKENPWETWSKGVSFTVAPTEQDMIWGYYGEKWNKETSGNLTDKSNLFQILDYKIITVDQTKKNDLPPWLKTDAEKQDFIGRYSRGLKIQIKVSGKFVKVLKDDGWELVKN